MQKDFSSRKTGKVLSRKEHPLKQLCSSGSIKGRTSFIFGLVVGLIAGGGVVGLYVGVFSPGAASNIADEQLTISTKPVVVFTFPTKLLTDSVAINPAAYEETNGTAPPDLD